MIFYVPCKMGGNTWEADSIFLTSEKIGLKIGGGGCLGVYL